MADVNANIGVHIDTSAALAELKNLQRQLATFHSSVAKNSAASAAAQKNLQTNLLNSINATGKFSAQMGNVRTSTESFTHALETNKLSMREYFRYAGGSTRTFGRLFKQEFDTIGKVAQERVKTMQTQYIKMGRDASGAMKAMSIRPTTLNMNDYATKTAIAAQKQALLNQLLKQGSTNLLNFGKNTQWAGRQLMVGFTVPLAYFGSMAAKTFMDLEKQAIRFRRVYGDVFTATEETDKALADIQKLAEEFTKYGVAIADTMEMAADAAAMGKTGAELTAQVAQATRLAVLGGVEQSQALETTISVTNAFGVATEDLASKINFLNAVENQSVVSIEDLTIAIPKAGPVVKQLGGSVEDLAFFLTAMKEGGINASEGANALKSGLAALINPTGKAVDMLAGFGVNINAIVEGNMGNVRETVIDFAQALDTLDPLNRARAIEQLFGKFQFSRLSTLFQNVTKDGTQASKVLDLAGASVEELAIMSERELGVLEDAIGTDFKESMEQLKLAIAPIGKEFLKAVTPIAKAIGGFLEKFNDLGDGTKKFIVIATTLVGVIGPVLLMTFGLLANGVANIIKLFITMRSGFLRAGANSNILAQQTSYLNTEQLEAASVAASLNQAHTKLTQSFTIETSAIKLLRQAYIDATIAATNFARANPGMMMPGRKGAVPKKFATGTTGIPGPRGAGDIVPILGAPGEAIIPSKTAQDPRFKPIIEALVNGTLRGFDKGTVDLQPITNSPVSARKTKALKRYMDMKYGGQLGVDTEAMSKYKTRRSEYHAVLDRIQYDEKSKKYVFYDKQGNIKSTFDEKQLKHNIAYAFKEVPNSQGQITNRPIAPNVFERFIGRVGQSGSGAPKPVRVLRQANNQRTAGLGLNRESLALQKELTRQGLTPGEIGKFMGKRAESHIFNPLDPKTKWQSGLTISDHEGINQYLNRAGEKSVGKLINNDKLLKELGYTDRDIKELKKSYSFAQRKQQPINATQFGHLAKIAELEVKAHNSGKVKNPKIYQAKGILGVASLRTPGIWQEMRKSIIKLGEKPRLINQREQARLEKVAVKPGQKPKDVKTGRGVNPSTTPLTKTDKAAIPSGQKLSHSRGILLGRGRFVPPLGATAEFGYSANQRMPGMQMPPGMAMSTIEKDFKAQQNSLRRQIELVEKRRLKALKEELKIIEDKNKTAKQSAPLTKKQLDQQKREVRSQRVGRIAGPVAGIAGIGAMAGFMTGNTGVGSAMMGVSALATIAPMLTNPIGIAVAAAATLAGGFFLLNKRMDDATKKQVAYVNSVTASTKKMQQVGELTKEIGASQIAQEQRETGARTNEFRTGFDREDNQFGTTFLSSEIGKEIFKGFNDSVAKDGPKAAKLLATQLAAYISDGVMSAEQANSVARAIGINLKDMSLYTNISGDLRELIGPDGQDLLTNPLKVRLSIISSQEDMIDEVKNKMKSATSDEFVSQVAVINAKNLEIVLAQRDAQYQSNQAIIDGLQKQKAATTDKAKQLQLENQIVAAKAKQKSEDQTLAAKSQQIIKDAEILYNSAVGNRSKFIDALTFGIESANKDNPFLSDFKDKSADIINTQDGMALEVQIKTAVLGGQLSIPAAIKLLDMFSGKTDKEVAILKSIIETTVTSQDPGVFQKFMEIMSGKDINPEIKLEILTDEKNFEARVKVLDKLKDLDGDAINLEAFVDTKGTAGLDELVKDFEAVEKIKSPITVETLATIKTITDDPTINMSGLVDIWSKYENATDEIKKTVIQEYIAIFKSIGDKEVEDLIKKELVGSPASPDRIDDRKRNLEAKYFTVDKDGKKVPNAPAVAGALLAQSGVGALNEIPFKRDDDNDDGSVKKSVFANILQDLKRTRNATIDAQGGAKELMRILGGAKDLKAFNGIDQQLSKLGANSDFIDFVGGLENAVEQKIIKINKKGVVSYGEFGKAAKKAYDEKQLGLFSAQSAQVINESIKQRDAFIKLKAAGVETADAQEMLADSIFATSLAAQKNPVEIRRMIAEYKNMKLEVQKTLEETDPEKAFDVEMDKAMKYYDFLEKEARAAAKPEIDRIEKLIEVNDKLIEGMQRTIEENYDRPIEKFNQDLAIMDKAAQGINDKYDAQEKALEKISKVNEEISQQEQGRLTLADALSQGDIAAAARAAQEMRAEAAQNAMEKSSEALQAAREAELAGLTVGGLTRTQIEEKIYSLEQARLPILASIRDLQDKNYNLSKKELEPITEALRIRIENIDTARTAWENQKLAIQKAGFEADKTSERFKIAESIVNTIKKLWEDIKDKNITLTINTVNTTSGGGGGGGQGSKRAEEIKKATEEGIALMTEAEMVRAMNTGYLSLGGLVPKYFAKGGLSRGTDTVPAMLTPGEFVMRKSAVDKFGPMLSAMNSPSFKMSNLGSYDKVSSGMNSVVDNSSAMYNYNIGITVPQSNANPNDIANAVIGQIKYIDAQRIRGQR
jgi:TP901 family phage tail tape measure protein